MDYNKYFIRTAVATPKIKVADTEFNSEEIVHLILEAEKNQVKILVLPELCVTGYTCQDLFLQKTLLVEAYKSVNHIMTKTSKCNCLAVIGFPYEHNGKLYNVAGLLEKMEKCLQLSLRFICRTIRNFMKPGILQKGKQK